MRKFCKLTTREIQILLLICKGFSNREIAQQLFVSERTVGNHRQHIYQKLNVSCAIHLLLAAIKFEIIDVEELLG